MINPNESEEPHKFDKPQSIYSQPVGHEGSYINQ